MDTYQMKVRLGTGFEDAAQNASQIAAELSRTVEFHFNGVTVRVEGHTDLDHLHRDYLNSSYLGWKTIGPDCVSNYPPSMRKRLYEAIQERNKQRDLEIKEHRARTCL